MLKLDSISYGVAYISGTHNLQSGERLMSRTGKDGISFIRETNIEGIYTYGLEQTQDNWEHKAGYIWSSRASAINKALGTKLVSIYYKKAGGYSYQPCGISMFTLNQLLEGTDYVVYDEPFESAQDIEYKVSFRRS